MIGALFNNGRLIALLITLIIVAGMGAVSTLPRSEDPKITSRFASIVTQYPGASAERVEALVTELIENKIRKLPEIKRVQSSSRPGFSVLQVELKDAVIDVVPVWARVRDLVGELPPLLPDGSSEPVVDDDRGYAFTSLIALRWTGPGDTDLAILGRYAKELQNRLRNVSGTDFVDLQGQGEEEILVEIEPYQAGAMGLTTDQVSQIIAGADAKVSAGELTNENTRMQLELEGELNSLERIKNIPVSSAENGYVYRLGDLATVTRQLKSPPEQIAVVERDYAIVVGVRMLAEYRVDQWSARVNQTLDDFRTILPTNVSADIIFEQDGYTAKRLGELVVNVLIGFAIIVVVLLLTLGWRSALIVGLSLPLTVMFTLACMKFYGLPIHQMSVTGLVVALGIMVDNAIVMADTIAQKRQQGKSGLQSVKESLSHLWLPLLGSTLTTILAFLPIVLMPGPAGEFVSGIALSVIFSLIGSYFISHTLVATFSGHFLPSQQTADHWYEKGIQFPALSRGFQAVLHASLRYPKIAILLVTALPLFGFYSAGSLTEQFFPPSDRDMFQIEVYMAPQSSIYATERLTEELTEHLYAKQGIKSVSWFVGNNAPSFYYNLMLRQQGAKNYAQAMITTDDFRAANRLIPNLQAEFDLLYPQAQILVRKLEQGPPFNAPIELRVYGPNLDQLKELGDEYRRILSEIPHVTHTRATLLAGTPKVWLKVNEEASRLSGVALTQIAGQLQANLQGRINGSVLEASESLPVRIRLADEQRQQLENLGDITLTSEIAGNIPLASLAELEIRPSRGEIPRRNGRRVNVVEGYLRTDILPDQVLEVFSQRLEEENVPLPAGYSIEFGGEGAERNEAVGNLLASVGIIAVLLVTVVVVSFNSFRLSFLIMITAIQAAGLGLLSVYLGSFPFGFTVIIGLLGLVGLAINAAIVIVAELKSDPKACAGEAEAICFGVLSCTRHISSTTITTVGGFLPLILEGGGFWPPFAVAIAGGTVLTTMLSFFFVPVVFSLIAKGKRKIPSVGEPTVAH
ncbi:efflux RND transporter permease subunit [Agarivorans sp. 1_MG-2023]|uniref:efflux RND transporter permease subunit n=1 Tax=Agarivorans sp. 1_MG-2023 TaxID=3062634 RepID=UPI0026E3E6F4|nr:efflux RND transporter permease subunit [Agarivorans sp. 1_MG-2023]MDO6766111.1 efflux RND transporter permease subunit [Agarivorans sp. 1_MG-2023]